MTDYISNVDIGQTIYIPDGENWTQAVQVSNLGTYSWYSIRYGDSKFVALGISGYISTSTNGTTWTQAELNSDLGGNSWWSMCYDGTKFVALGANGYISTSTNGTTWTQAEQVNNLGSRFWTSICYNGTKFIVVSNGGYISTSSDGTTWTQATQNANLGEHNWRALAYGNNKFVALGAGGYISTSINGATWTTATQNSNLGSNNWRDIYYDGTKFVALGKDGYISTSTEGITWTIAELNSDLGSNNWHSICYNGTKFVALAHNTGYISNSPSTATTQIPIGGNNFDGQWVEAYHERIETAVSASSTSVDMTPYLPNDNYDYEVLFWMQGIYKSNAGYAAIGTVPNPADIPCIKVIGRIRSSGTQFCTQGMIPIKASNRTLYVQRTVALDTASFRVDMMGYRRIGTNN